MEMTKIDIDEVKKNINKIFSNYEFCIYDSITKKEIIDSIENYLNYLRKSQNFYKNFDCECEFDKKTQTIKVNLEFTKL